MKRIFFLTLVVFITTSGLIAQEDSLNYPAFKVRIPTQAQVDMNFFQNWRYQYTMKKTKDGYIKKVNDYKKPSDNVASTQNLQMTASPNANDPSKPVVLKAPDPSIPSGDPEEMMASKNKTPEDELSIASELKRITPKLIINMMYTGTNKGNLIAFESPDQRTRMMVFNDIEYSIVWESGVPNLKMRNPSSTLEMRINYVDEKELVLFNKSNNELLYFVRIAN